MKTISKYIAALIVFAVCLSAVICPLPSGAEGFVFKGDVNGDGAFDISDVLLLQKWLLAVPDTEIANIGAADICSDGRIDVFDLAAMKRALISKGQNERISTPTCKAAAFACIESRELLYSDNINERTAPASLTKLLTASVALKYLSPDTVITVGSEQSLVKSGSSLCLIQRGHRLKLYDLLTGMLMASGNDAAYTVAVSAARAAAPDVSMNDVQAVEYFVRLMNGYAASIGMKNSSFANPDGWDDEKQYTTVSDLLILAGHAFSVPEIRTITGTCQKRVVFASGENITWTNSNALLVPDGPYYCSEAVGMKTGTTADAGNCLIAVFEHNGRNYISVVTGCGTNADRYELTLKLRSLFSVSF